MSDRADEIIALIKRSVLSFSRETGLHEAIQQILKNSGVEFFHEYHLGPLGRIDFLCKTDRIGIECKCNGSQAQVMRQLSRYTGSDEIAELIVVTTRLCHAFPKHLGGKPLSVCRLMRSIC